MTPKTAATFDLDSYAQGQQVFDGLPLLVNSEGPLLDASAVPWENPIIKFTLCYINCLHPPCEA